MAWCAATHHLIGTAEIAALPAGAFVVNLERYLDGRPLHNVYDRDREY